MYAAITSNLFVFFIPGMSERAKLSGVAYRRLKSNREENSTKYTESTDAYAKKAEKFER